MKQRLWDRKRRYNKLKSLYRHKDKIVGKEEIIWIPTHYTIVFGHLIKMRAGECFLTLSGGYAPTGRTTPLTDEKVADALQKALRNARYDGGMR